MISKALTLTLRTFGLPRINNMGRTNSLTFLHSESDACRCTPRTTTESVNTLTPRTSRRWLRGVSSPRARRPAQSPVEETCRRSLSIAAAQALPMHAQHARPVASHSRRWCSRHRCSGRRRSGRRRRKMRAHVRRKTSGATFGDGDRGRGKRGKGPSAVSVNYALARNSGCCRPRAA